MACATKAPPERGFAVTPGILARIPIEPGGRLFGRDAFLHRSFGGARRPLVLMGITEKRIHYLGTFVFGLIRLDRLAVFRHG
jgi:hypothetical protein